ncbi:Fms-interacting protein-domain-containing protein [Mycotypha africana]|uniref:Fms-interacting protein-domain-containing protein n=1 Tax=Mycotypha africana TaxID=64632 RepID=UPI0023016268|nr:Fms-interacting protein-domain-containing protein [Mycotypha africana]KAI8982129.1 Fms-interacting protein-domain-containing protein [Mycotypha africana]
MTIKNTSLAKLQDIDEAVKTLQDIILRQYEKKLNGSLTENSYSEIDEEEISRHFEAIKDLAVESFTAIFQSKQATLEARERMNEKKLALQEVMYEKRHILEEIVQCQEFRSVFQDIELIPLEEFQENAGEEYKRDVDNPHQLFINRLKYELVIRSALKEQQEALQIQKTQLIKENRKAQMKIDQIDKLLDDFVQVLIKIIYIL